MKFSDWAVLGSTLLTLDPTIYLKGECGCIVGMAAKAKGDKIFVPGTSDRWPWLFTPQWTTCPECGCDSHTNNAGVITCLACHVQDGRITFDKAIEYIRALEPAEQDDTPVPPVTPVWNRYHGVAR